MIEPAYKSECVTIYQGDCLEIMPELSLIDGIVTDPPYGIGEAAGKNKSRTCLATSKDYGDLDWDSQPPPAEAFRQMERFGVQRIIWGGNFFVDHLYSSSCWLVWDKVNYGTDFADCELAWTSIPGAVRKMTWQWHGMLQQDMKNKERRYHPTQKPVSLMRWCLSFLPEGGCILDPFAGSGTTGVACIRENMSCILIEREPQYVDIIIKRIEAEEQQGRLF